MAVTCWAFMEVMDTYFPPVEFIDYDQAVWENIDFWGEEMWNEARVPFKTDPGYDKVWYGK